MVCPLVMSNSLQLHGLWPTRFLCSWDSLDKNTGFPSPGDLPDPEIEPGSPTSQVDFLLSELPGKLPEVAKGNLT